MKSNKFENSRLVIRVATAADRKTVYRLRHDVYARELGQHEVRKNQALQDSLDEFNTYIIAERRGEIVAFISITPPGFGQYSIDKYFERGELPFTCDDGLFELRILTVTQPHRGETAAVLLVYAAFRWVQTHGGTRIVAIGRREILPLYEKFGMEPQGREVQCGSVVFELMTATVEKLRKSEATYARHLIRLERTIDWRLEIPFFETARCFHGGAFFEAIGDGFDHLERRHEIINADVLDAWFPPSPKVLAALRTDLDWLVQTSPPADAAGLVRAIATARGVKSENILAAAGSSDLIFLALPHWLKPGSRVLLLDPTYGEYAHVLEQVVRCRVERFPLIREDGYEVNLGRLQKQLRREYDLVVWVNPNSPTGRHVPRVEMERWLRGVSSRARIWIDETYVEYAGAGESMERFASASSNVVVCKSMSKVYALSGVRAAYLCGGIRTINDLRANTPPWAVSLPAQVAAVKALEDAGYYTERYAQTHLLREELAEELRGFERWEIIPGVANFLLCHLPESGPAAAEIVRCCRERGLYLRDASGMGNRLGKHALRIAVKDGETNRRMVKILGDVISQTAKYQESSPALK